MAGMFKGIFAALANEAVLKGLAAVGVAALIAAAFSGKAAFAGAKAAFAAMTAGVKGLLGNA